jgi:hypothetical protein
MAAEEYARTPGHRRPPRARRSPVSGGRAARSQQESSAGGQGTGPNSARGRARRDQPPRGRKPNNKPLTSPRPGTSAVNPLPDQARHAPTLRANPCPEVTDPICRLPLPTLVYRLEALDLGDLLRIWVRAGATPPRDPHPDFQGPTGLPGHRSNCGALRVPLRISLREDSTEPERSGRKENSSRGSRRRLWGLSRYRVNTRIVFAAPQPGSVMGNGFPFARRTGFTVSPLSATPGCAPSFWVPFARLRPYVSPTERTADKKARRADVFPRQLPTTSGRKGNHTCPRGPTSRRSRRRRPPAEA